MATGSASARAVAWPENAHVATGPRHLHLRHLLANAAVCVLPLKPNLHASGMTTTLEAASVATPVVIAGDGGLAAILGPGPRFVPAGDPAALASAIDQVLAGEPTVAPPSPTSSIAGSPSTTTSPATRSSPT